MSLLFPPLRTHIKMSSIVEHRDVDAGQGTLLLGKVLLVAYLMAELHGVRK